MVNRRMRGRRSVGSETNELKRGTNGAPTAPDALHGAPGCGIAGGARVAERQTSPRRGQGEFMKRSFVAIPAGWLFLLLGPSALAQGTPDSQEMPPAPPTAPVQVSAEPSAAGPAPAVVVEKDKKNDTTRELEDGGLGLEWVYLNADVGSAFMDLASLKASNWQLQDNSSSGPAFGFGAGVRLVFLSAGFRVRDLQLSSFNLWETDLEAALHFRIWRFDLYLGARGGYAFLGSFSADSLRTSTGSST